MGRARAVWFTAPRTVELREEAIGRPGPGEILVETVISAISHGTEMLVYRGEVPPESSLDLPTLAGSFGYPIKYGYASVGRVVEAGGEVGGVSAGDPVFALHPHQTRFVVSASLAWRLPPTLGPERGIFAANVETALNALLDAPIRIGERVVVFGQGVVGLLVGLLARRNGAGRVVVVDRYRRRREVALALGADAALAPSDSLAAELRAALEDAPADVAFEASGNPAALQAAIDSVADEGTVVACSWYGTKPVTLALGGHFHRGRVRLRSTQVGRLDPGLAPRWTLARRTSVVTRLLETLPLDSLITHRVPLSQAAWAYQLVDEQPEETVQVALAYD
ncbi:MAG: zinc-binding dehydrogenase [Chloroflexota bacterium]|nr:zinc-binding dehydrogenase [Chloroflexota bacterium]